MEQSKLELFFTDAFVDNCLAQCKLTNFFNKGRRFDSVYYKSGTIALTSEDIEWLKTPGNYVIVPKTEYPSFKFMEDMYLVPWQALDKIKGKELKIQHASLSSVEHVLPFFMKKVSCFDFTEYVITKQHHRKEDKSNLVKVDYFQHFFLTHGGVIEGKVEMHGKTRYFMLNSQILVYPEGKTGFKKHDEFVAFFYFNDALPLHKDLEPFNPWFVDLVESYKMLKRMEAFAKMMLPEIMERMNEEIEIID